jgi:hypothetical protein
MKFAFLTTKLSIFCLVSFSICLTDALAVDQTNEANNKTRPLTIQRPLTVRRPTPFPYINRSKSGLYVPPGKPNSGPGLMSRYKLNSPLTPGGTPVLKGGKQGFASPTSGLIPAGEEVVLQSRDIGSFGLQWQSFSDYLTVPKGCDQIPLNVTFTNGPTNPFQNLRITLAGKSIATIKDFSGRTTLSRNLTGAIGVGDSLLTVQVYGPVGSKLNWKFTTAKIVVTKVNPNSFGPTDKITIEGRNFSDHAGVTQVLIGNKQATVVSAKSTSLQIKPPTGLAGGKTTLVVMVGNQKSTPIQVTIKGAPEIHGVNMVSTAPGQPLTITGSGFSTVASENEVMIGPYQAEIISVSPTSIECRVPLGLDEISPAWYLPVKVKTNNIESTDPTNSGKINIQSRVF